MVFQNKMPTCQYRGVGHPIACAVTEALVDGVAAKLGMDPFAVPPAQRDPRRRLPGHRRLAASSSKCCRTRTACAKPGECATTTALRAEQAALRKTGVHRGIGVAALIELTNPSAAFYGVGGARIAAQDGATMRLEPTGVHHRACSSVGEQGQGAEAIFAQIAADAVGVAIDRVRVVTGDTDATPYGGGTWASARRRHRRRGGAAGRAARCARTSWPPPRPS